MKIRPVNSDLASRRLREVNYAGSQAVKTKKVLDEAEKAAISINAQLVRPSKHMDRFNSAMKKLNVI